MNKKVIDKDALVDELYSLYESDPDAFEISMDRLEENDIDLYRYVCSQLNISDDSEE